MVAAVVTGCDDGYLDPITAKDPGPDQAAPVVTVTSPTASVFAPYPATSTDVTITFEATDDIELNTVVLKLDGTTLNTYSGFKDYRRTVNSYLYEDLEAGEHTLEIVASDVSGKTTTSTFNFEVTVEYQARDGEIFYMPFEDSPLDLVSDGVGTTTGNISYVAGKSGKAIRFDGEAKSYMLFPSDAVAAVESMTLSVWVRPIFLDADADGGVDGIQGLVNMANTGRFWGNINFFLENGSNPTDGADMRIQITSGTSETWITNVNDQPIFGAWSHHVITYDAATSQFKYYINGQVATTAAAAWTGPIAFEDVGPLVFGTVHFQTDPSLTSATGSQTWAGYLNGDLDEVRIFNRALTEQEVAALYAELN